MSSGAVKTLVDDRERRRAEEKLATTFLVEAAAGTGKTTLLVSRVLAIVRSGTPLPEVAAITFTEKAAGELKVRLREKLEEKAREEQDGELFRKALLMLDLMPVSTIHAFCRELLTLQPVEAGVDPAFVVLDDLSEQALRDEAWQTWVAEQFMHECQAVRPFLERGMAIETTRSGLSLRDLFELLYAHRDALEDLQVPCEDETALARQLAEFRTAVAQALRYGDGCRTPHDTLADEIARVKDWFMEEPRGIAAALSWLQKRPKPSKGNRGRKENWGAELEQARAFFLNEFTVRAETLAKALYSHQAAQLVEWLKGAVRYCEAVKTERRALGFQDLLIKTRDMLRGSRGAREELKSRFRYLLVDEFQDTDPLQTEIVFFLAERAGQFAARWDEVELEPGKLFLVGDPKQSIYRFRRADLDWYGRVKEQIERQGERLHIRVNFRSDPQLTEEVNALFAIHMQGPTGGRYEPEYVPLEASREPSADPRWVFLPPPEDFEPQKADATAAAEAACVAEYLLDLMQRKMQIQDKDKQWRPLTWSDVAVLFSTTTRLSELEQALQARGIPYQVAGKRNLWSQGEMVALHAVLAALDNPHDAVSVVGALRSPFFGCTDEELLRHHLGGGTFHYMQGASVDPHVEKCFAVLRKLHERRRELLPSEMLGLLFEETDGLQVFALKAKGAARVANLLRVLDAARAMEQSGDFSFHRLVKWLKGLEELKGEEAEAGEGGEAVRLLTIHKAKGLEFPVVVLYHLGCEHDSSRPEAFVDRNRHTIEFRCRGCTRGYEHAETEERDRAWHEAVRKLYVATTRAREMLVVPAYWIPYRKSQDRWFVDMLRARYPDVVAVATGTNLAVQDTSGYKLVTEPQERLVLEPEAMETAEEAAAVARAQREAWRQEKAAAAALLNRHREFLRPSKDARLTAAETEEQSRIMALQAGTEDDEPLRFGLFVHRVLERITLPAAEDLADMAAAAAEEFEVDEAARHEGEKLVRAALRSSLFVERILPAGQWWREVPFVCTMSGKLAEGVLDLVFLENGEAVIVDYKTDRVSAESAALRAEEYHLQAAVYAHAMREVLQRPVKEVLLFFLRPQTVVRFQGGELERNLSELLRREG